VTDLDGRLAFVLTADALKRVERRNPIGDGSRRENTAEHSWHIALMALVLAPHSNEPIDVARVVSMLLVHDVVEIDAGDTFVYDDAARASKEAVERRAADRLFSEVPELRALWEEFEADETAEARFAHAVDRLQPLLLNHATEGGTWDEYAIPAARVRAYNAQIASGSTELWGVAQALIEHAVEKGWLQDS
jgi:putative hydrolase of HD superfamily